MLPPQVCTKKKRLLDWARRGFRLPPGNRAHAQAGAPYGGIDETLHPVPKLESKNLGGAKQMPVEPAHEINLEDPKDAVPLLKRNTTFITITRQALSSQKYLT